VFFFKILIFSITPTSRISNSIYFTPTPRFLITVIVAVRKVNFGVVFHPITFNYTGRGFKYNCGFDIYTIWVEEVGVRRSG